MAPRQVPLFGPDIPPDVEHAAQIREEALDWMERHFPVGQTFSTGDILRMSGEQERRWLISRLQEHGIADETEMGAPAVADALAVLFLRSRGVKFREAIDAVQGHHVGSQSSGSGYGGIWNRLISIALKRMRTRFAARLLGSAVFSLLRDPDRHPNCLIVIRTISSTTAIEEDDGADSVTHDYVYNAILERPVPSCWVLSPLREALFLADDQLPTRTEITSRSFQRLRIKTDRGAYELLIGTMNGASISNEDATYQFVGTILDIMLLDIKQFFSEQDSMRLETAIVPGLSTSDDLQLWLITKILDHVYPGSLNEISEAPNASGRGRVLASSVVNPWEPSMWDPPKSLEMLSGYSSQIGLPLVVEQVRDPWTRIIASIEPELRYLHDLNPDAPGGASYSAVALPVFSNAGNSIGSLYALIPSIAQPRLNVEVKVLSVFARITGEIIERQRGAIQTGVVTADIATFKVLKQDEYRDALIDLLNRTARDFRRGQHLRTDVRLPFLLLSAHAPQSGEYDPVAADRLKVWLVETLRHLEWRSFVKSFWPESLPEIGDQSFIGEMPGVGMMIAFDRLVSKDELDRIRGAFASINPTPPVNSPVKFVEWVLDVPADRILNASDNGQIAELADDVEDWAFNVATVVDDVAQSSLLAADGDWDAALRRVRRAIRTDGGSKNGYLYRLAAECSFSLGDWPVALRYSQYAVKHSQVELGSGYVRSICQEADAHLVLGDVVAAWDKFCSVVDTASGHPLPRYYRGQALMLLARLLREFEIERLRGDGLNAAEARKIEAIMSVLVSGATEDLTAAADLLDTWGLIPESYQYKNFHLVPTLLGLGTGYLLRGNPGPAASRLQSARRSFTKDDLFFREYLFAKCWEQGLHTHYGEMFLSDDWAVLGEQLESEFGSGVTV